ncbi:MAG: MoaD/ThiS family protein [Burkholderiaceae bacterium]|nr:MoaD/ThiS family protein [Burkholderiaceae bacterium]
MDVQVSFMGVIASVTGTKQLALALDGTPTLRTLIDDLERRFGTDFGSRIYRSSKEPRQLQMHTRIFINRELVNDRALDKPLALTPGSSEVLVYLLPAACGG